MSCRMLSVCARPTMDEDFREFKAYYALSAKLIDAMTKEQVAECARLLALHLADYRQRFGDVPHRDLLTLLGVVEINEEQANCSETEWRS